MEKNILFAHFPFDFGINRPVELGYGVSLRDSQLTLSLLDSQLEALVVPEDAAGTGQVHVCMGFNYARSESEANIRLWRALAAIQLGGRLHWRATGAVCVNREALRVESAQVFRAETAGIGRENPFEKREWFEIREINIRITRIAGRGLERIRSALTIWSQVACGSCSSWQLAVVGLMACIECCFPQPKRRDYDKLTYGSRLAKRVARFLKGNGFDGSKRKRLIRIYDRYRNSIAHGVHDPFVQGLKARRQSDFEFLFETSRLVLLGMIGLTNAEIKALLPVNAGSDASQRGIDRVGSARQEYLKGRILGKYAEA